MSSSSNFLIIVGGGKFAQTFGEKIELFAKDHLGYLVHPISWGNQIEVQSSLKSVPNIDDVENERLAFLHVGSGREFQEVFSYCEERKILMVEASTGDFQRPEKISFPYVEAPNLSIPIIKLFQILERGREIFESFEGEILESHQASKKSVPGTAIHFAKLLNQDPEKIESVRDPIRQEQEFGIPKEHLEGHALHRIRLRGFGAEIELGTRVLGRDTYIYGLLEILRLREKLGNKRYFISKMIDEGWL